MAKAYPPEFRDDVVRVARKYEAPINQIAKDFARLSATEVAHSSQWASRVKVRRCRSYLPVTVNLNRLP